MALTGSEKTRRWRQRHPDKYAFDNLRTNAKRRGKKFDLSLAQFQEIYFKTDYGMKRGKTSDGLTLDRVENNKGYSINNISVIPNSENVKKQWRDNQLKQGKIYFHEYDPHITGKQKKS